MSATSGERENATCERCHGPLGEHTSRDDAPDHYTSCERCERIAECYPAADFKHQGECNHLGLCPLCEVDPSRKPYDPAGPEPCSRCEAQKVGDLKDAIFWLDCCDFPDYACYAVLCDPCFKATHDEVDGFPKDITDTRSYLGGHVGVWRDQVGDESVVRIAHWGEKGEIVNELVLALDGLEVPLVAALLTRVEKEYRAERRAALLDDFERRDKQVARAEGDEVGLDRAG
jgi:hypothetical protein